MSESNALTLETALDGGILRVRMNRPDKKNALTDEMYRAFVAALLRAETDAAVRCVLVCGVPGAFSAGNDIENFLAVREPGAARPAHELLRALAETTVPLVAAVDGVAVGIGTTLLLHCDFVLATPLAKFALPFVNLGLCPEAGSSLLLRRLAGYHHAARLLMLGDAFDAEEGRRLGFVHEVCPSAEVEARAHAIAEQLVAKPRAALRATKALLKRAEEPLCDRIEVEIEQFGALLASRTAREIMRAFLEKRAPDRGAYD